ncbi:hypothetical protein BGX27_004429, partial [Mortierella sp. AM989]
YDKDYEDDVLSGVDDSSKSSGDISEDDRYTSLIRSLKHKKLDDIGEIDTNV